MIHGTKVLVGDVVELAPHKRANADDIDLERVTVLEINDNTDQIKVVFNNNDRINEKSFDKNDKVDWFSLIHVTDIQRDYKIIKLTDNVDEHSRQTVSIITAAKIIKQVSDSEKGYKITGVPSKSDFDTFVFVGVNYNDINEYKGTINRIAFSNFRIEEATIDGRITKAYFCTAKITELENIFVSI
jgi:hypothetical protein